MKSSPSAILYPRSKTYATEPRPFGMMPQGAKASLELLNKAAEFKLRAEPHTANCSLKSRESNWQD